MPRRVEDWLKQAERDSNHARFLNKEKTIRSFWGD